ncbi:MAG: class I SAM-dependent methyltransferase [Candidatus Aureabacteria bacterium]|nr:class I SAM-dependent methyltransferase [Candidatus Auribacterota bacterium]
MNELGCHVKRANRDFYDIVGAAYESIDGRRSERLAGYVAGRMEMLSRRAGSESMLDLGCGNGFVARVAKAYFRRQYAVDISCSILRSIADGTPVKLCADSDSIPIRGGRVNCVVTFAMLHHCFEYEKLLSEIHRVLAPGGVYYSDHDMDELFFSRFRLAIEAYHLFNNAKRRYRRAFKNISAELYDYSEYHRRGIPSGTILSLLARLGFREVTCDYHWFGLSPVTDRLFGVRTFRRGLAPLTRIIAVK